MPETLPTPSEAPKGYDNIRAEIQSLKEQLTKLTPGAGVELNIQKLKDFVSTITVAETDPKIIQLKAQLSGALVLQGTAPQATDTLQMLVTKLNPTIKVDSVPKKSAVLTGFDGILAIFPSPAVAAERSAEFKVVHEQLQKLGENVREEDVKNLTDSFKKLLEKPGAAAEIGIMENLLRKRLTIEGTGEILLKNLREWDVNDAARQKQFREVAKDAGLPDLPPAPPKGPSQMAQKVTLGIEKALTKLPPAVFEMLKQWGGMDEKQAVAFLGNLIRGFIADYATFIAPGTVAEGQIRAFGRAMHQENQLIAYMNVKGSAPSQALVTEWAKEFSEWEKYSRMAKNNKLDIAMVTMPTMLMLEDAKTAGEYRAEFAKVKQEIDKRLTAPATAPTTAPAEAPKKIGGVDFLKGEFAPGDGAQKFEYADKKVHIDKKKLYVEPDGADKSYLLRAQGDAEPTGIKLLTPVTGEKPEEVQVEISTASGKTVVKLSDIVDKIVADRANTIRKTKVIVKADKTIELA